MNASNQTIASSANGTANMTDIIDIRPIHDIPMDFPWVYWLIAGLILLALVGIVIGLIYMRKKRKRPAAPPKPAHELALEALQALNPNQNGRQFYFSLSEIFRTYLEQRFAINALEMTSQELLSSLKKLQLDTNTAQNIKVFIYNADPVKYAGGKARPEVMEQDLKFVQDFIESSREKSLPEG